MLPVFQVTMTMARTTAMIKIDRYLDHNTLRRLWVKTRGARQGHTCCGVRLLHSMAPVNRVGVTGPSKAFIKALNEPRYEKGFIQMIQLKKRKAKAVTEALEAGGWKVLGSSEGHELWGRVAP
jgi:hypothetical protein